MSDPTVESFVHSVLDADGASRSKLTEHVWLADLPEPLARFSGRGQRQLLYTFDPDRWEQGARLEFLGPHAGFVDRLRAYALARGASAEAHLPAGPDASYAPCLAVRFSCTMRGAVLFDESEWLAEKIRERTPLPVKGNPLATDGFVEGPPPGCVRPSAGELRASLTHLAETWNARCATRIRDAQRRVERDFDRRADGLCASASATDLERKLGLLRRQMQLTAECKLDLALLLWLDTR